jgi:hypothetical protein
MLKYNISNTNDYGKTEEIGDLSSFKQYKTNSEEEEDHNNNNNNLVLCYLYAKSTATRPITGTAQCRYW